MLILFVTVNKCKRKIRSEITIITYLKVAMIKLLYCKDLTRKNIISMYIYTKKAGF